MSYSSSPPVSCRKTTNPSRVVSGGSCASFEEVSWVGKFEPRSTRQRLNLPVRFGAPTSDLLPDAQTPPLDPRTPDRPPIGPGRADGFAGDLILAGLVMVLTGVVIVAAEAACAQSSAVVTTNRRILSPF